MSEEIPSFENEDVSSHDDSDIMEDAEKNYDESFWPKNAEEPNGCRYKGKKKIFTKAVENIKILFKKGAQKQMPKVEFRILDNRNGNNGNGKEVEVEITKGKEKGEASLKFFGPNSKKDCTVMITKNKKHEAKFVKIIAMDVIKPLLEKFISGEGWVNLVKTSDKPVEKPFVCDVCRKGFVSERTLENHVEKFHGKNFSCNGCDKRFNEDMQLKLHMKTHQEEETEMEWDEGETISKEKEEEIERSKMRDKQILEKEKKHEEQEKLYQAKKEAIEQKKIEMKKKESVKNRMKVILKKQKKAEKVILQETKYPKNVTTLPKNMKHLVEEGDLQLLVPPDGACAANSGAAHIFQDPKHGSEFRMVMNNHMADRWNFYKNKISFPYVRNVGVKGETVRFEEGEEDRFCSFLRSKESAFLWSDSEDLQLMSNLYQMKIRIITTKGEHDLSPTVNWIGPDPELNDFKFLPEGIVPDMTLIHYDEVHYNLVIKEDSNIVKYGTVSQQLEEDHEERNNVDDLALKYKDSQNLVRKLYKRVELLERELLKMKNYSIEEKCEDMDTSEEITLIENKKSGSVRQGPQYDAVKKPNVAKFECKICSYVFESKGLLDAHMSNHEEQLLILPCDKCEKRFKSRTQLEKHMKSQHGSDLEFNCNDCSFQGDSENSLKKHMNVTHHKSSETNHSTESSWTCNTCGSKIDSKRNLMVHRKEKHPAIIKSCRYFLQGNCAFEENICWYSHGDKFEEAVSDSCDQNFQCSFCEKSFRIEIKLS